MLLSLSSLVMLHTFVYSSRLCSISYCVARNPNPISYMLEGQYYSVLLLLVWPVHVIGGVKSRSVS